MKEMWMGKRQLYYCYTEYKETGWKKRKHLGTVEESEERPPHCSKFLQISVAYESFLLTLKSY